MSEDKKLIEFLSQAIELERRGREFYLNAYKHTESALAEEIFKILADEELKHLERIEDIYQAITGESGKEVWFIHQPESRDLDRYFYSLAKKYLKEIGPESAQVSALKVGLEMEERSIAFYQSRLEQTEVEDERKFLTKMIEEERSHFQILKDMEFYFTNPEGWFQEKEKSGLNGA